ncbi:MAG: hypothetical protein R2784_18570 [Saprospiraceae bacterium]
MRLAYSTAGLCLLLTFFACQKDNTICNPLKEEANFLPNSQVSVQYSQQKQRDVYSIENEDYNVFQYKLHHNSCETNNRNTWTEMVAFEIPPGKETFHLENKELTKAHCFYQTLNAEGNPLQQPINKGSIRGKKEEHFWSIQVDVETKPSSTLQTAIHLKFSKVFY